MVENPNRWAVVAIFSSLMFASAFGASKAFVETNLSYESGAEDVIEDADLSSINDKDTDGDGLPDRLEDLYDTDKYDPDTDGDQLNDSYEIENGLDPLDPGSALNSTFTGADVSDNSGESGDQNETSPNPNNGADGDPDRDGLTNSQEADNATNPNKRDTDGDNLGDGWEAKYNVSYFVDDESGAIVTEPGDGVSLLRVFDPLSGNWDCPLLTDDRKQERASFYSEENWTKLADERGRWSCDYVLDFDDDSLPNFIEEQYGTDPFLADSDMDGLPDAVEIARGSVEIELNCGTGNQVLTKVAPFDSVIEQEGMVWFSQDDDRDGRRNGPSDFDSDRDGMPDGYEFCFGLDPTDNSDAFGNPDQDGMTNLEEYVEVARLVAEHPEWNVDVSFTNPNVADTDGDGMPDGWEVESGINPLDPGNSEEDPDRDGWDANGNGRVRFSTLLNLATVATIETDLGEFVRGNETVVARARVVEGAGVARYIDLLSPCDGYVYKINVAVGDIIDSRLTEWMVVVEDNERFTNLMEYNARFDENGLEVGASTNPSDPDTDKDGLLDGIEVMGWQIRVVTATLGSVLKTVSSDPSVFDTDLDGLSDSAEYSDTFTNASAADTDNDGLSDYVETRIGYDWNGTPYFTNASMFDTDNDQLEDGEEVVRGEDGYITNANDSDTDNDGLKDGYEVLKIPRPFQTATDPLNNDTDGDSMLDGWEMQIESAQDNTKSHSLWIAPTNWLPRGCVDDSGTPDDETIDCQLGPGGWLWRNAILKWFKIYELEEMNLSGISFSQGSSGRWAIDPAPGTPADTNLDVDNDSLQNTLEKPGEKTWNTNPVRSDSDDDGLPDGWEVKNSALAANMGLIDSATLSESGAKGLFDPRMPDSDLNGIEDGDEDPDQDGLDRAILKKRYCPNSDRCHISPFTPDGKRFYDDLENFTNYEEYKNGTSPVVNDTDGDDWIDGSEVYYQDQDDDSMASGWEYYFQLDPFDPDDGEDDLDADSFPNWCEYKWNTNPRSAQSQPDQFQLCSDL